MPPYLIPDSDAFAAAEASFHNLVRLVRADESMVLTHGDVEEMIRREGTEVLRQLLQGHLDLRADGEARSPVEGADGVTRTHRRDGERRLETVLGTVVVHRQSWSARGVEALQPLDAYLNLPPDQFSHGVRHRVCEEALGGSFERAAELVSKTTGARIAKRQCEEVVVRAATDFDGFYTATTPAQDGPGEILVLSFDGKGVVMRTDALRPATRKAAMEGVHKLKTRLSKGEKPNRKRMAVVAAVYALKAVARQPEDIVGTDSAVRRARPRPTNKRVWASLVHEPDVVIEAAFEEAIARDPARTRTWVALVDGNLTQIQLVRRMARRFRVKVTLVLDVVHVIEYLWNAAWCLHDEGSPAAEVWVKKRLTAVLHGKASTVAAAMRRSATMRQLPAARRKPLDIAARYLLNHVGMLQYQLYLPAGLPIASGVIEGACRYLVNDRMDITGARWGLPGAEAVLRLRALWASGDLAAYWEFHAEEEFKRNHLRSYAAHELAGHALKEAA